MNKFLRDNSQDIFYEVKRSIESAISDVIKRVVNAPFSKFPYRKMFLSNDK